MTVTLLITVLTAACGSDGATTPTGGTSTDPNADRLEITFGYASGASSNMESMDLFQSAKDGRLTSAFIATPDVELQPEWSRDASRLTFTRFTSIPVASTTVSVAAIWIANADGSGARKLAVDPASSTSAGGVTSFNNQTNGAWSPDGSFIAFRRSVGSTSEDGLAIIGADGTGLRWLVQGGDAPSWSGDGRIAFGKGGAIWTINADGSGLKPVTPVGSDATPKWSRDGTRLVFVNGVSSSQGTAYDVVTTRADGSDRRVLATGGINRTPSWSPDGQFILYEHVDLGDVTAPKCSLFKIPSAGGSGVNLTPTRGVGYCGGASWRSF